MCSTAMAKCTHVCSIYLLVLVEEYRCRESVHCCIIELGINACRHGIGMSMPVNASKHGTSQLIDSQRSVVNTSAGTTRYRGSSGGMACDRGSALLTCLYFSHPSSPVTGSGLPVS